MSFTTVAFAEVFAAAADGNIEGVVDPTHRVNDDDIYISKWNRIIAAHAWGYSLGTVALVSPSLRRFSRIYIDPFNYPGGGGNLLRHLCNRIHCPVPLDVGEALNCYHEPSGVDAAHPDACGVWLADAPIVPVAGEIHTVRMHSTDATTFVQDEWKSHEITISPDLPTGRYQIVGARFYGAYIGLFRFVFREQANRPGAVILTDLNLCDDEVFRLGKMGVWGEFDAANPPAVDICMYQATADTQLWGYIDLLKIS